MSEMLERMARAICLQANLDDGYADTPTLRASIEQGMWRNHLDQARAAIAAFYHPPSELWRGWRSVNCSIGTDGMEEFTYFSGDYGNWLACHHAMLDAAQGIEARQGGDASCGSVEDESPARRDAP